MLALSVSQALQQGEVVAPLQGAPLVTGLVLAADQRVGTASAEGLGIQVTLALDDRALHVGPDGLGSPQLPGLTGGIGEKVRQIAALRAAAGEGGVACPVRGWRQRSRDAAPQVGEASIA